MKHLKRWTLPRDYYGAEWPEYYRSGCGQHRDSDALTRSNFACMLVALGGESETVIVVHENHWAVGWVEWIAIHQDDTASLAVADRLMGELADYPIIDEEHYSATEMDEAAEVWRNCYNVPKRIAYIRAHESEFDFHNFADMRGCVRGEYFSGYAPELLA